MTKPKPFALAVAAVLLIAGLIPAAAQDKPVDKPAAPAAPAAPRPIGLQDILAWKSIGTSELSPDGSWFMYQIGPVEGESEVVLRQTAGTKEHRFPIGEAPRFGSSVRPGFSADSKWAAFLVYPGSKETKSLRKDRKRIATTAVLVDLATGEKTEFEKVRAAAFSGENPGFVALHRYAPESQEKEKDKWTGSDLLLRELATGKEVNIGNVAEYAFDKMGGRLALVIDAQGQAGNGLQLRDMAKGTVVSLDNDKAAYKSLAWTEKGEALAVLKGKEDKAYEDKLWSVLAFDGFGGPKGPRKIVYDPAADKSFPEGMTVSPNRAPEWTESFDAILFGIQEAKKKKDADKKDADEAKTGADAPPAATAKPDEVADEDLPDLVIWHGQDGRLQSQQQVQEQRDKNYSYEAEYRPAEKKFIRLAADDLRYIDVAPKGRFAVGQDNRAYQLDTSLDGRGFQDIYTVDMKTGRRTLALTKNRWFFGALYDGSHFLYYDDGHFHTYDMITGKSVNITKDVPASFFDEDNDTNVVKPPDYPVGSTKDGLNVLLSDGWDVWSVPVSGAGKAVNLTVNGAKDKLRYRRLRIDPEEKAVDLAEPQYFAVYGEWTKKAGIARLEKGRPAPAMLLWDDAGFGGLAKAKKAGVYVYTRDTYKDYPDYYGTDALMRNGRKLTEANPQQKDFLWSSGSILLDYTSAKGDKLQGALFLPANYEKGKRYPTIVYYYEKMSQQLNRYASPTANGFNKSVYTSHGYAVLYPGHHLQDQRSRHVRGLVRPAGHRRGRGRGGRRPRQGRPPGALVGRLSDRLPRHPGRLRRGRGRRPADQHDQHVQLHLLQQRLGQHGHLRIQPGPLQGRLLGQPRGLPAQLAGLLRRPGQDAAHHPPQRQGRRGRLEPGHRVLQHPPPHEEAGRDAPVRRREPRPGEAGQPQGLHGPDEGVLRPPPHGQAGPGLVHGRRLPPQAQGPSEGEGQGPQAGGKSGQERTREEVISGRLRPDRRAANGELTQTRERPAHGKGPVRSRGISGKTKAGW